MSIVKVLLARAQQGHRTAAFPDQPPALPDRFRGLPAIDPSRRVWTGDALGAGAPERRVDGYAFRHFRPSLSMRASASVGPQVPAS